jgi:hypothetical protein
MRLFCETKYDDNKNPIMTSLFIINSKGETKFLIAVSGWKNTDDMKNVFNEYCLSV